VFLWLGVVWKGVLIFISLFFLGLAGPSQFPSPALLTIILDLPIYPDSIDLQDREAPSAQAHPPPTKPTSNGSLAPHQAETIREVAAETAEENLRSPRVSWTNGAVGDLQQYAEDLGAGVTNSLNSQRPTDNGDPTSGIMSAAQQQDALAIAQNGGLSGQEADDGDLDGDGDDGMDDDMMDKISSSPSIEDGGSIRTLSPPSPRRADSRRALSMPCEPTASPIISDARSPSLYLDHPEHMPLRLSDQQPSKGFVESLGFHHHLLEYGEFPALDPSIASTDNRYPESDPPTGLKATPSSAWTTEIVGGMERLEEGTVTQDATLGTDCTDSRVGDLIAQKMAERKLDDADDAIGDVEKYDLTIPYEDSDEDDDGDFSDLEDTRFLDSGWGGDCLQDAEDIDFEFVYALHTFVATVEGQANATKGDTMVLLDDSNSYWWLVRVVKDSSIGAPLQTLPGSQESSADPLSP
jgi:hypothetical protein